MADTTIDCGNTGSKSVSSPYSVLECREMSLRLLTIPSFYIIINTYSIFCREIARILIMKILAHILELFVNNIFVF